MLLKKVAPTAFDDRIEVYSPGTLPPGVSLEKMRRLEPQSVLRNPIVVAVFRDLGGRYIEQLGTGVRRIACNRVAWPWRPTACPAPVSMWWEARAAPLPSPGDFGRSGGAFHGGKEGTPLLGQGVE